MTRGTHRVPSGRHGGAPRRAFSVPDELTCYFDTPDEPANIHMEVRVPGRLDHEAFRQAAAAALLANFRASGRRTAPGPLARSYTWEYPARLDLDPVSFTTFADSADLAAQRTAFIARAPSIESSPAALLLVASGPDCDHVILNAHHATMDGLSWLELLRDVGRRYRRATGAVSGNPAGDSVSDPTAAAEPAAADDPAAGADRPAQDPGPSLGRSAPPGGRRPRSLLKRLPARVAGEGGGQRGCGLHMTLLAGVPAARPTAEGAKATLNDALIAAFVLTVGRWNDEHGIRPRPVRVTVPFNARAAGKQDAAGNHSRIVTIVAAPRGPDSDPGSVLADVARQVRDARKTPGPQVPAGSRNIAAAWCPAAAKRTLVRFALRTIGPLVCDTAMVTNLGKVASPPDFGLPGVVTMGLSGPAQMPRGLSIAAITAGGQVQLGLRYNRALLNEEAAASFLAGYTRALQALTRLDTAGPNPYALQPDWSWPAGISAPQR
jgi:NRPS condensation-like uncharacterized protein